MTEEEARDYVHAQAGAATLERIAVFVAAMLRESERQNLISPATRAMVWSRHVADSVQLLSLADDPSGHWVDIGSGAGFPGAIVAIMHPGPVSLIEPRGRRAAFLREALAAAGGSGTVIASRAENATIDRASTVSARAVGALDTILTIARGFSDPATCFILPKGQSAEEEVASARSRWHGMFHVERSLTDARSAIVIARSVSPRCSASQ